MATILAVDYGHKKIGFAIGQTVTGTATPLLVVKQNGELWVRIDAIFSEWQPKAVVIGEPKLADGEPHPLEKMIETFSNSLKKRYNAMVFREDEALTSYEAGQCDKQGKQKKQQPLDAYAAAIFLESWMRNNAL